MNVTKNPISILEELAAVKIIPKPEYTTNVVSGGFMCEIKCADVRVSAIGCNKKIAKYECASQALVKLRYSTEVINDENISVKESKNEEGCTFNAIGRLNEICAQKGLGCPNYIDLGWRDENFIIECKCSTFVTEGRASTKKQAKQLAAKEMLNNKFDSEDLENLKSISADIDAKVLEIFRDLKIKLAVNKKTLEVSEKINEELKIEPNELEIGVSLEQLQMRLSSLGIKYKIGTFQTSPLILVLQAVTPDGKEYTFLESGGIYSECQVKLLQVALEGILILNS